MYIQPDLFGILIPMIIVFGGVIGMYLINQIK